MIFTEGGSRPAATVVEADSSHPDVINVADAELLACGAFHRDGPDLHLNGRDGQHVIIPGYFASEHPAMLVAPNGERLTADVLALLVARADRDQYAQAQPARISSDAHGHIAPDAIGHVEKIVGDVTVVRDGVAVTLDVGDAVYRSDIIQTGSSSAVGISLSDGGAVNLVANTRMVLNASSYGANSDPNVALFNLVEGTSAFVAGKVAHGGDMKIATPVATMSVGDGSSSWAHQMTSSEIAAISAKLGDGSYSFAVFDDHGIRSHGIYDLVVDGSVVGSADDPNQVSYLDSKGDLVCVPQDKSDLAQEYRQWLKGNDAEPTTLHAIHGSGSPIDAPTFPQLVNLDLGVPSFSFTANGGGTTFGAGFVPALPSPPPGVGFVADLPLLPPGGPTPHSNVFIWNGIGNWDLDPLAWNQGVAPASAIDIVIIQTGKSSYDNSYTIGSLTVDFGATLDIVGGSLTVSSIANAGLIEVGAGSTLTVENGSAITGGALKVGPGGTLNLDHSTLTDVAISDAGVVNFGPGDTLSPSDVLTFVGSATVKVEGNTNFDLTLAGLTAGDVIDLGHVVVTSAVWNGASLILNGVPVAFSVAGGLPAGDTFAFKSDGSGGTDLTVRPQLVGIGATPAAGAEGSAIPISFSVTGGATVTALVISDIPLGATLSDGHGHTFTATAASGSIDVHTWNLASLTVTPPNGSNFTLSATVTAMDGNGYSYSAATTETVTVSPPPPSIGTGANATAVYETGVTTPVALDTAVTVTDPNGNLAGATVTITAGLLAGDTLSASTAGTGIAASYDATTGILTLSGTDTLAHYAEVLDSVTYASTAADPTNGGADTSRTISWQVGDGVSPSNIATSTVGIVKGSATVAAGSMLEISTPSNQMVTFSGDTGELKLDNPAAFGGHIVGFTGGDSIDLAGIDFNAATERYDAASHLLTVSDGTHSASLAFDYFDSLLNFASDGHGGTLITTQPATIASGGFLEISKLTVGTVSFGAATGTLQIDNPADFSGHIQNFAGTAPDAADSDVIDLVGIDYNSAKFSYDVASGKLTVTEGALSASLTFDYFGNNLLNFAADGHGGTAITTQPANIASGGSLEISKLTVGTISFFGTGDLLALDNPGVFSGHINGFSDGDRIDISGIDFTATKFTESYNAATHLLTVGDGTHSASFYLDYLSNALNFASDGKGGTLITNQPTGAQTIAAGERLDIWGLVGDTSTIAFASGTGELKLDNPAGFSGHIAGFTGTQADATHSDVIDLVGIDHNSAKFAETYDASTGKFIVTDGTNNASFTFDNFSPNATFSFASDGNGGTLILDPPAPAAATASGSGDNFKFIFHPGDGMGIVAHSDWRHEATAFDHTPALSGSSTPGEILRDWLMEPGHLDHMTNSTLQALQAHLDSAVHLH